MINLHTLNAHFAAIGVLILSIQYISMRFMWLKKIPVRYQENTTLLWGRQENLFLDTKY